MKIKLLGASGGEVTGSAYLLQTDRANVMFDCGLFRGVGIPRANGLDDAVVVLVGAFEALPKRLQLG